MKLVCENILQKYLLFLQKIFTIEASQDPKYASREGKCMLEVNSKILDTATSVPYHIETSQLICSANRLTGFYMMENTGH